MRLQAHRALRLFVTAGACAAGLCLIIGSVVLVANAAGSGKATHVSTAARRYRLRPEADSTQPGGADQVLRTFAGIGDRTTPRFTVTAHSRWQLQWLYQCTPGEPGQDLIIREGDAVGSGISVSETGPSGRGSASAYSAVRTHYLVVITNCAWTARVLDHG
jgi:hypothetical protein